MSNVPQREIPNTSERHVSVSHSALLVRGPDLMTLNECQWGQLCKYPEIVSSRTIPKQKLRNLASKLVGLASQGLFS